MGYFFERYTHTHTHTQTHIHTHKHTHTHSHTHTHTHTHTFTHIHTHTPCDRCKVGYFNESITNLTLNEERKRITNEGNCVRILCIAEIAAFQPALSYGPARDLYQTLGLMSLDGAYFKKKNALYKKM